jgi:hypothetical protein
MGSAPLDAKLSAQRIERIRPEGESAPSQDQRIEPGVDLDRLAGTSKLGAQKLHIPRRRMRDQDRAVENRQDGTGDRCKRRRSRDFGGTDAVDLRRAADANPGMDDRADGRDASSANEALDAHFDDAIVIHVESRHLEIHERQRRLRDRQTPRRSVRRGGHAPSLSSAGRQPRTPGGLKRRWRGPIDWAGALREETRPISGPAYPASAARSPRTADPHVLARSHGHCGRRVGAHATLYARATPPTRASDRAHLRCRRRRNAGSRDRGR